MTDQDKPQENFLERWSRKKAGAQRGEADEALIDTPPERRSEPAATTNLPFDVSSLPSLESITSATDIRAFLAPGVPRELIRAALRRAWTADPAIRDFAGLQENDWDFTKPDGVPGFGPLPPDLDIKKLISEIFGEPDKEPAGLQPQDRAKDADEPQTASASELSQRGATPPATADQPLPSMSLKDAPPELVQRGNDPITRGQDAGGSPVEATVSVTPRRHGGALPKV